MQFVSNRIYITNMVARKEKRGTSFSEGVCLRIFSGYLLDSRNVLSEEHERYQDSRNARQKKGTRRYLCYALHLLVNTVPQHLH